MKWITMKCKKASGCLSFIFFVGLWLGSVQPMAQGARIAGEGDVTPSVTGPQVMDSTPPKARPPAGPPTRKRPRRPGKPGESQDVKANKAKQKESKPDARFITIDFNDVEIGLFIKFIADLTGKNFVLDKAVKGNVTIISPSKISLKEAYKVFESVLEVHGYTTVQAGSIIKIVPAGDARSKDVETRMKKESLTPEDKMVTQLIPLKYADPDDIKRLFAPMVAKSSIMVSYPPTGMLILTDVQSNIQRLLRIIEAIDVGGVGEEISVVPLKHASAPVLAKSIATLFQKRAQRGRKSATDEEIIRVVPDERINVLILLATELDTMRIKQLIKLLDKETPRGEGDIHVYYCQNANAEELAKVLTAIPTKDEKKPPKGKTPVISKDVQIVADKATNSLVITAKKDDYLILEDVIKKLDIMRGMVYIEALLMEVSVNKKFDLGVRWQSVEKVGSNEGRNIAAIGRSAPGDVLSGLGTGFSMGVLGDTIEIAGVEFASLAAILRAYRTDSDVQILSTPQILTTDNEEASIEVAKNIPFQTRVETTADVSGREFSSFEYRDVGVLLKITPQISHERFVRLKIEQEVSQIVQEESVLGLPTTLKRKANTTVIVKDGTSVVIGGLIAQPMDKTTSMVPCLGDVAGVGWLFKTVSQNYEKTNLYIFLTPHVIENPQEAKKVYDEKRGQMDHIHEGVIKMFRRPPPDMEKPGDEEGVTEIK